MYRGGAMAVQKTTTSENEPTGKTELKKAVDTERATAPTKTRSKLKKSASKRKYAATGVDELDEALGGGLQPASCTLIQCDKFAGGDRFWIQNIVEGLKQNIPSIIITTDLPPQSIRDKIAPLFPKIRSYESHGLLSFIDLYSKRVGIRPDENDSVKGSFETLSERSSILKNIRRVQTLARKRAPYHKLIVDSLSSLLLLIPSEEWFQFLQRLTATTRNNKSVGLFLLYRNVHDPHLLEAICTQMDGVFELKHQEDNYLMRLEGFEKLETREWIAYHFSPSSFEMEGMAEMGRIGRSDRI